MESAGSGVGGVVTEKPDLSRIRETFWRKEHLG